MSVAEYGVAIVDWHYTIGRFRVESEKNSDNRDRYLGTLKMFHEADLHDPHILRELAQTQLSGSFERFYGEIIPREMLSAAMRERHADSLALNEAARIILRELEASRQPDGERETDGRRRFPIESEEQVMRDARAFYGNLGVTEDNDLGGVGLLVACSLERMKWKGESGEVELLTPQTLGFVVIPPRRRSHDVTDYVRDGMLEVEVSGETGEVEEEETDGLSRSR